MQTSEIPEVEWSTFFDAFSRRHEGWLIKLDVLGVHIDAQHEVVEWPLVGITRDAPAGRTIRGLRTSEI
jgi:hypothetical protein